MTSVWLEVLIDPGRLLDERETQPPVVIGAALLVRGQTREYQELAVTSQWPRLGEWPAERLTGPLGLLAALGLQVAGQPSIGPYLRLLAASDVEPTLRSAAVVLAAIALGADDREEAALQLLQTAHAAETDASTRRFLVHHQAIHVAYLGGFADAAELSHRVASEPLDAPTGPDATVSYLAQRNERSFRWSMGSLEVPAVERRSHYPPLAEADAPVFDALAGYLETQFKGSFDDPFARTITFQAEDDVESTLKTALFRARCVGDWNSGVHYQRLLAKYRLLNALGERNVDPGGDFVDLVRAADTEATRRAVRMFVRVGPLPPLAEAARYTAARTWSDFDLGANLALLAAAAPLLSSRDASAATKRVLDDLDDLVGRRHGTALVTHDAMDAIGGMLPWAGMRIQRRASDVLRKASAAGEPIVVDALPRALRGLQWRSLRPQHIRAWLGYVEEHVARVDAHQRVAAEAAKGISAVEPVEVAAAVDRAYQSSRSLLLVALMADLALPSLVPALADATRQIRESVEREMAEASAGRMTLGGAINLPLLLGRLVLQRDDRSGWTTLMAFVRQPASPIDERASVLNLLAEQRDQVPSTRRRMMRGPIPPSTIALPLLGNPESLAGAALRFRVRFGDLSGEAALNELLSLTTHPSRLSRVEAARSLAALTEAVQKDVLFALGLSLAQDADDIVRAAAARFLPRLAPALTNSQRAILGQRMASLLAEPGETVPLAGLHGINDARAARLDLASRVRKPLKDLRHHPSARVRLVARAT